MFILVVIPLAFAGLFLFIHLNGRPKGGNETRTERDRRIAHNIKVGAAGTVGVIGALAVSGRNSGYDNGYPGGSNGGWGDSNDLYPTFHQQPQNCQGFQQPSYIQQQPWFQQPYYATQMPMQDRAALFQYQNPFVGFGTPYNQLPMQ